MSEKRVNKTGEANKLREFSPALSVVVVFLALWYCWFLLPRWRHSAAARDSYSTNISADFDSLPDGVSHEPFTAIYADASSGHAVFPYSVIPGGIRSGQELAEAARRDALVAQHYAGFQLGAARVIRLKKDRRAYVSYRLGGQIFWTKHKVTLRAGETLVTDGKNVARGRCGNRVSDAPNLPVSPKEPGDQTMSRPVFVPDPVPAGIFGGEPVARLALRPERFIPPTAPPGGPFTPFFPPIFSGGGPGTPPGPPGPPPVPPITSTPEPASGFLVALGFIVLALASLLFRK